MAAPELPPTPTFSLAGKRALVAGASSGIGLGCATGLARAGADVTFAARSTDKLAEIVEACRAEGHKADALTVDVGDIAQVSEVVAARGPFDILVNSAGLARHAPIEGVTADQFDAVMAVNLRGAFFLTQAVAKGLIAAGKSGSLINISSQMGHVGGMERSVYCASKFAVEGFTRAMAIELGPHGIRVNTICPTFVRTPLGGQTLDDPERKRWILDNIKLGRIAEVEDVVGAALYLASEASAMVTGSSLMVDGGWTAH